MFLAKADVIVESSGTAGTGLGASESKIEEYGISLDE